MDTGGLSIDDCLIEKPFAKEIEGVYWQYSSKLNDYAKGLNITVLTWSNGKLCHIKECKSRKIVQQRRYFFLSMKAFMLLQSMNKNTIYEAKLDFQQKFMGRKINGDKALRMLIA